MFSSKPLCRMPLAALAPGLLAYGDMDDVIALAGGRLQVQYRVDAEGRVVSDR